MRTVKHVLCQLCGSLINVNMEEIIAAGRTAHMQSSKPKSSALNIFRLVSLMCCQQQACQGAAVLHEQWRLKDLVQLYNCG
jgi:hypothetical protein